MTEHWEMAQREQFAYGEPSFGVPFDVSRYGTDASMITINAALEFRWCRERLAALAAPGYPALLWHVSVAFVFDRPVPEDSRWARLQEIMRPYCLGSYPDEPGWAIDPEIEGVWETFTVFWAREFWNSEKSLRTGIYFDNANDLITQKWIRIGFTDAEIARKRVAWRRGTESVVRRLRDTFGDQIVLVANWAKDKTRWCPYQDALNGITVEGDPTTLWQKRLLVSQLIQNARNRRGAPLSASWNENRSILPFIWRTGTHWTQRATAQGAGEVF